MSSPAPSNVAPPAVLTTPPDSDSQPNEGQRSAPTSKPDHSHSNHPTPPALERTHTSATQLSTTTTLQASQTCQTPHICPPQGPPAPDVVSFFDPASVGGGGPLVRIATARSARELARERSRSATSTRPVLGFSKIKSEEKAVVDESPDSTAPDAEKQVAEPCCACPPPEEHIYPDGGYGWVVVGCCTTLCALTNGWGMIYGVFQEYYVKNTFPDAKTSVISLAGATQGFCLGATAFISGRMGDRFGFKRVLITSAFICWLGLFAASFSKALWSTILCQGIITGIGQGIAVPLFMSLPSQWFYKHRGLASGIAMGGAGIGGGVSTLVVRKLLSVVGASRTLLIMSFVNLFGMAIAIALIRTRPTSPEAGRGRGPLVNKAVLGHSEFWSIACSLLIGILGYGAPFTFLSQWVGQHFPNSTPMQITAPFTILTFCVAVGRALVGWAADFIGAINTFILVLVLSGVVQFALWLTASSYASICVFGAIYGLVAPGYLGLLPQIVVTLFGPAELASNTGLLLLFNSPGNLVSGPMGGALYDSTGGTSFKWTIIAMASLQVAGGIIALWARFKTSPRLFARI